MMSRTATVKEFSGHESNSVRKYSRLYLNTVPFERTHQPAGREQSVGGATPQPGVLKGMMAVASQPFGGGTTHCDRVGERHLQEIRVPSSQQQCPLPMTSDLQLQLRHC